MFKLSTYNFVPLWHVPISKDHEPLPVDKLDSDRLEIVRQTDDRTSAEKRRVRFVCLSDTHDRIDETLIPWADVFLHCGDAVNHFNSRQGLVEFNRFLGNLPHRHKIVLSGNHATSIDPHRPDLTREILNNAIYLQDELIEIEGIKIYASPWHLRRGIFYRSNAFAYDAKRIRTDKWSLIVPSIDILLTHIPPFSVNDYSDLHGAHLGCPDLLDEVIQRIHPRVHVFGHIHDGYGVSVYRQDEPIYFINAALKSGRQMRRPIVFDYIY